MDGMLLTKKACEHFAEVWQQEVSEVMYRDVQRRSSSEIAKAFCKGARGYAGEEDASPAPSLPPKRSQKKPSGGAAGAANHAARSKGNGSANADAEKRQQQPDLNDLLAKYDKDGSLAALMDLEKEAPESMLSEQQQRDIKRGTTDIVCDVCGVAVRRAHAQAARARALRDEAKLIDIVSGLCVGEHLVDGRFPKVAGNPPVWATRYSVKKRNGRWTLGNAPKNSSVKHRRRRQPGPDSHTAVVMRNAMVAYACRSLFADDKVWLPAAAAADRNLTLSRACTDACNPASHPVPFRARAMYALRRLSPHNVGAGGPCRSDLCQHWHGKGGRARIL